MEWSLLCNLGAYLSIVLIHNTHRGSSFKFVEYFVVWRVLEGSVARLILRIHLEISIWYFHVRTTSIYNDKFGNTPQTISTLFVVPLAIHVLGDHSKNLVTFISRKRVVSFF